MSLGPDSRIIEPPPPTKLNTFKNKNVGGNNNEWWCPPTKPALAQQTKYSKEVQFFFIIRFV